MSEHFLNAMIVPNTFKQALQIVPGVEVHILQLQKLSLYSSDVADNHNRQLRSS